MTQRTYPDNANMNWNFGIDSNNRIAVSDVQLILLMDIREELKRLNVTLNCRNALEIPKFLRKIELNTRKKKAKK